MDNITSLIHDLRLRAIMEVDNLKKIEETNHFPSEFLRIRCALWAVYNICSSTEYNKLERLVEEMIQKEIKLTREDEDL